MFHKKGKKKMKNENYLSINGQKTEIPADKLQEIKNALAVRENFTITENKNGEKIAKIGKYEFLVLERSGDTVSLLLKSLYKENVKFGANNDFRGSNAQKICREFAAEIAAIVGEDNIVEHTVDLTSDDGLRDYGMIREKCSLLTTELYRRYVDILDLDRLDAYYWLVTPWSTPRHESSTLVKCVSPRGNIILDDFSIVNIGVRPFLILKSNIFGS